MPYIPRHRREDLTGPHADTPGNAGELNYVLTSTALAYVELRGLSYQTLNDVVGAFEGAKMELYRRIAVPYEDGKIVENGDVYPPNLIG